MAVGDVRFHQFGGSPSQIRKKFSLVIGRYVLIAKAQFDQELGAGTFSGSFGALQLFFGYHGLQRRDESVVYLGPNPDPNQPIRGGNAVLQVAVDVEGDPSAPDPEHGRFLFQALTSFATIRHAKLVVFEVGSIGSLDDVDFPDEVEGLEEPEAAVSRIRDAASGESY